MGLNSIVNLIEKEKIFILYVKSGSCSVCVELLPEILELSKSNNIAFKDIYIEDYKKIGSLYNVFTAPLVIVFVSGKEVYREGYFLRLQELEKVIYKYKSLLL